MSRRPTALVLALGLTLLPLAACGGDGDGGGTTSTTAAVVDGTSPALGELTVDDVAERLQTEAGMPEAQARCFATALGGLGLGEEDLEALASGDVTALSDEARQSFVRATTSCAGLATAPATTVG